MAEVFFADEQDVCSVPADRLCRLAEHVMAERDVSDRAEVSLLMVDAVAMTNLHETFLDRDGPTDVLAFPIDELPWDLEPDADDMPILLGDVVVCPEVAQRNAPEHAGTYEAELDLLVVHGLLHLLGFDHNNDTEAAEMEELERRLLETFELRNAPRSDSAADAEERPPA